MFKTALALTPPAVPLAPRLFQDSLEVEAQPKPDFWWVESPLVWEDAVFGLITVPVGFRTDLASIPRVFRNLPMLDPNGVSRRPAVMHDWLYGYEIKGKDFADSFLKAAIVAEGGSAMTASSFYYAVHWFGGGAWAKDKGLPAMFQTPDDFHNWAATSDGQLWASHPVQ